MKELEVNSKKHYVSKQDAVIIEHILKGDYDLELGGGDNNVVIYLNTIGSKEFKKEVKEIGE